MTNVSLIASYMRSSQKDNAFLEMLTSFDVVVIIIYVVFLNWHIRSDVSSASGKSMRYFGRISDAMQRISEGDLNITVDLEGDDEFSVMAASLNKMVGDLKDLMDKEREAERTKNELITNIAHDLRTPLTSIIGYLELLSKDGVIDQNCRKST